jgi:hypothetical protein
VRLKGANLEKRSIDFYLEEIAGQALGRTVSRKNPKVWPSGKKRRKG